MNINETTAIRDGDVLTYVRTQHHCREGMAVVSARDDGSLAVLDTFWETGDRHVLTDDELATAEVRFNTGDVDEVDRYFVNFEDYAPSDRFVLSSQHGLVKRRFVRKGATPDLTTKIENARQLLVDAEEELERARSTFDRCRTELDALLDEQRGTQPTPPFDPCDPGPQVDLLAALLKSIDRARQARNEDETSR